MKRPASVVGMALAAAPVLAQDPITVAPNVLVSAALADRAHASATITADPTLGSRLLACAALLDDSLGHAGLAVYLSTDRGQSWRLVRQVVASSPASLDPACAYGPGGIAYAAAGRDSGGQGFLEITRSSDGGADWEPPYRLAHAAQPRLTVDRTGGARKGWVYLFGTETSHTTTTGFRSGVTMVVLSDGPQSAWSQQVTAAGSNHALTVGPAVVLSDGTLVGIVGEALSYWGVDRAGIRDNVISQYNGRANGVLKALISSDGRHLSAARIDDFYFRLPAAIGGGPPALAVDATGGPFRDRVYAVWADERSGRLQIHLSRSADKGKTWSSPAVVNDATADAFNPGVAVNSRGVVGVTWYDRQSHPHNLGWSVRFTASLDGGDTFLPSVRVSERDQAAGGQESIALAQQTTALRGGGLITTIGLRAAEVSGGRPAGLAADADGEFHAVWSCNATGVPQLWTSTVGVAGSAAQQGGGDLASLVDVTAKTTLQYMNEVYDRRRGSVEADIALVNTSKDTLTAPFKLRVLSVESEVAIARLDTADNAVRGPGAVWDFTPLVDGGRLLPGQRSRPKRVRFTMHDVPPYAPGSDALAGYVVVRTRALAGKGGGKEK